MGLDALGVIGDNPLVWIGLGLIIVVLLAVTLDILIIPTMVITIVALTGWFIFLVYVYQDNASVAVFLGTVFLVSGGAYLFVIIKLRMWKWMAQEKKVPLPPEDRKEEIHRFNEEEITAHTDLRPVGKIKVGKKVYDGLSEGGFIPRGSPLTILSYAEGQYKVKKK